MDGQQGEDHVAVEADRHYHPTIVASKWSALSIANCNCHLGVIYGYLYDGMPPVHNGSFLLMSSQASICLPVKSGSCVLL